MISYRSLLLSTIVLNDNHGIIFQVPGSLILEYLSISLLYSFVPQRLFAFWLFVIQGMNTKYCTSELLICFKYRYLQRVIVVQFSGYK